MMNANDMSYDMYEMYTTNERYEQNLYFVRPDKIFISKVLTENREQRCH